MKRDLLRLTLIVALLGFVVPSQAQQPSAAPQASLTVVNAITGDKNVFVSFDGQSIWPPGFTAGQSTAAVMFPSGTKQIKIECEGFATTEAKLDLPAGANCAMILFPGELVTDGPEKGKRRVGVFVPSPHQAGSKDLKGKRWKAVLVGTSASQEFEINGKKLLLAPRKSAELAATPGGVRVRYKDKEIFGAAPEDAGEYWIVLYPGETDFQAVMLTHSPFKIPAA